MTGSTTPSTSLDFVLGYDGSEPAKRALAWAERTLAVRPGTLHVVYVTSLSPAGGMSGLGYAEVLEAEDEVAADLEKEVGAALGATTVSWSYERREGPVAEQLLEVATGRDREAPEGTDTVLVVGRSAHAVHKVIGSVPVGLLRHTTLPVVTIP